VSTAQSADLLVSQFSVSVFSDKFSVWMVGHVYIPFLHSVEPSRNRIGC